VYDAAGRFVAASITLAPEAKEPRPALAGVAPSSVLAYAAPDGERVVGSALSLPRLGWTIVLEEGYVKAFAPIATILTRTVGLNLGIVLVLSALAFGVVTLLVRPLHALSDCAQRLRDGEGDVDLPVVRSTDEVGILARSFGEMVESLTRAKELQAQLAITDGLTKIHNHRYFQDELTKEIRRHERSRKPLALVLLDIDDFKTLNDRHGHDVGDAVLARIAVVLVSETRQHDVVARYGGEEFALLAPETDRNGAIVLGEKLRTAVSRERFDEIPGFEAIHVTVSVGVSVYHGDRRAFFREADRGLYAAKDAGKDCVVAPEAG
jgi:diguanylate cyclase (GGDEF)-like protein